jgi:hypothetical protein
VSEVLKVDPEVFLSKEMDGELVILDLKRQRYITGNASLAVLWPLLVEGATREQLAARLVEEYGIEAERAAADIEALLEVTLEMGMVSDSVEAESAGDDTGPS